MVQIQVNPQCFAECAPLGMSCVCVGPQTSGWKQAAKVGTKVQTSSVSGSLPLHASTVGLVRNLQTGNISPQFHLLFDDHIGTFHLDEGQEPTLWVELITFQTLRSDYDDEDYVPELLMHG
jgi:hypothetical protein